MPRAKVLLLASLAMSAFAGNSLLCRAALKGASIDAVTFTSVRLLAGAATLWLLIRFTSNDKAGRGNWPSALALFGYAILFSLAYGGVTAATGALILFSSVQATMIGYGLWSGERFKAVQMLGLAVALAGLVVLLLPGLAAPPLPSALLMAGAGIAWGIYSLRGKTGGDPTKVTAGNFMRAAVMALAVSVFSIRGSSISAEGVAYAVASGALASGVGYAIWYSALPFLKAASAATIQLSVPAIAAAGGALLLHESLTSRVVLASAAILGGIALVIAEKSAARFPQARGATPSLQSPPDRPA